MGCVTGSSIACISCNPSHIHWNVALYGRNPQLPSALDFQLLVKRYPTIETEYGQELVRELQQARAIAKKNIEKKQKDQKKFYDQKSKDVKLKVDDLVMLKTDQDSV